ncbi:MAG: vWA domain-containing protein [Verrucomicrobiota bacterium JB025]|nr:VWA domain-containing protein [Verrucomicrobiota bacterium JB025]
MPDDTLHFAYPLLLALGLAVCAGFVVLFIRFDRRRDSDLAKIIHPRFRQRLTEGFSPRLRNLKRALWLLAILLAFIALARPQKGYEWREVKRRGIDILFAIDTSRSMLAQDLTPNRLERSRLGITDFVDRLEGDRVGLIPFAGSAFALCPLTLDYGAFRESLDAIDTDLIPRQGTDLASAIREAERLFDQEGNNHRILVLITDGEDLQGDVLETARTAAKNGTIIHTVGVGNPAGAPIPVQDRWGRTGYVRDQQGQVVQTKLDEATLKAIAEATGGLYVPLGRGAEGLNTIYQEKLSLVPKHELNQRMERIPLDHYIWPLGASIALFAINFFLSDRRRPKKQRALPSAARRRSIATTITLGGLCLAPLATRAETDNRRTYNKGTTAYQSGDFETAANTLRDALKTPDLSLQQKAYYNLGNTLYRTGQTTLEKDPQATIKSWESSIKAFEDALSLNAADEDASYNRDFVKKKLEALKQQQDQQNQDQQNQDQEDQQQQDNEDQQQQDSQDQQQQNQDQQQDSENQNDQQQQQDSENQDQQQQAENQQNPGEEQQDQQQARNSEQQESDEQQQQNAEQQQPESGDEQQQQQQAEMTEREPHEEMTPEQAKRLLESLSDDERTVIPIHPIRPSRRLTPDNSTKGKTW